MTSTLTSPFTSTLTTTLRRLALVGALGAGLLGVAAPAGADPVPAGPGDITACPPHVDCGGQDLPDGPDDFTAPEPGPTDPFDGPDDVTAPEPGPTDPGDGGGVDLPDAPVGDVVVANPTFTG